MLQGLGFRAVDTAVLGTQTDAFRVIFNTVAQPVLHKEETEDCRALLVELASTPGFLSDNALIARGLPGTLAPRSSGELIAETILRLSGEELP